MSGVLHSAIPRLFRVVLIGSTALIATLIFPPSGQAQEDQPRAVERPVSEPVAQWLRTQGLDPDSSTVIDEARLATDRQAVLLRIGLTRPPAGYRLVVVPGPGSGSPWQVAELSLHRYGLEFDLVRSHASYDEVLLHWHGGYGTDFYDQYFFDPVDRSVIESRRFEDPRPAALLATEGELLAVYRFGDFGRVLLQRPLVAADTVTASLLPFDEGLEGMVEVDGTVLLLTESREWYRRGPEGRWAGRRRTRRRYQPPNGVRVLHPRLPQFRVVEGGIEELRLTDTTFIPLDLPDVEQYRRARPEHAEWVPSPEIDVDIGPVTEHDGRVWFGLTFYDGEGMSGVGGLGWFDPDSREAGMIYPDSLADWSLSAITGRQGELILGLASYPEGAVAGGGLARYELATGRWVKLDVPGVIPKLAVRGETIYALSTKGLYVIEGETALRHRILVDLEGEPVVLRSRVDVAP